MTWYQVSICLRSQDSLGAAAQETDQLKSDAAASEWGWGPARK